MMLMMVMMMILGMLVIGNDRAVAMMAVCEQNSNVNELVQVIDMGTRAYPAGSVPLLAAGLTSLCGTV